MAKIIIFGIGSFAEVVKFYLSNDSQHEVIAFTINREFVKEKEKMGLPIIAFEEIEKIYPPSEYKMYVAIGYSNVNKNRAGIYFQAKDKKYELISYICSKSCTWKDLKIGDNCFIFENQTIQPFVEIGNNVVLWSGNHVGHHSKIGNHCFITSHVVVSGHCTIKPYCFLGVNSTLRDGITLAKGTVLGAGALVTKDTIEEGIYYGASANKIKIEGKSKDLDNI